jgi:very-short-patch-repair endonuclease
MDAVEALTRLGGLGTRTEVLALTSRPGVRRAVLDGRVVRLKPGTYALPDADHARVAARALGGTVSMLSAAMHWGWKVRMPPTRPTVTLARHRRLPDRGVDADVRWADLAQAEVVDGVTSRVRTLVDCARWLPFPDGLSVADSALRAGDVTKPQLLAAAESSARTGRPAAIKVARAADGRSANPFESSLRAIAIGVPGLCVEPQVPIGTVGHADLADVGLRIAIEAESWEFHATREAFRYDVRRYTSFTRLDWLVVRFLWEDVMHRADLLHSILADVVRIRSARLAVRAS